MFLADIRNNIVDYIINSGQNVDDWAVDAAAEWLRDNMADSDVIADDEMTEALIIFAL